jgi:hypothetical protein
LPQDAENQDDEEDMATTEERMMILRMVEQGKVSAEEGARLLAALVKGREQESAAQARPADFDTVRTLKVRVTELGTNRQKANVTLPLGLVTLALRRIPLGPSRAVDQVREALAHDITGKLMEVVDPETGMRIELTLT